MLNPRSVSTWKHSVRKRSIRITGTQARHSELDSGSIASQWIPAFAGMTRRAGMTELADIVENQVNAALGPGPICVTHLYVREIRDSKSNLKEGN